MPKGKTIGIILLLVAISTLILNSMGIFGIPPLWILLKDRLIVQDKINQTIERFEKPYCLYK